MKISKLIEKLERIMKDEGDYDVVLEIPSSEFFHPVYDVTGKWSSFDRSKYDGSVPVCFIHGEECE